MAEYRYYRSCDDITLYNFHKVLETDNYAFMVIGYDGYDEIEFDEQIAKSHWGNIYEEYCKLSEDNKSLMYFATASELLYMETRFQVATELLKHLVAHLAEPSIVSMCIEALKGWKFKIDKKKDLDKEIQKVFKALKGSKNKINLKRSELEAFKPEEGDEMSLTEQIVKMEQALGRNEIDPKTTTMAKWIAMNKELKLENEAKRKAYKNGR
jgi:hypothetical protein